MVIKWENYHYEKLGVRKLLWDEKKELTILQGGGGVEKKVFLPVRSEQSG